MHTNLETVARIDEDAQEVALDMARMAALEAASVTLDMATNLEVVASSTTMQMRWQTRWHVQTKWHMRMHMWHWAVP